MTQQHGRTYEHTLVNGLDELTPAEVWVSTVGYSGNDATTGCDLVVTVDPKYGSYQDSLQFNIEAKKRQGEGGRRVSNVFTGPKDGETGKEELERFVGTTPGWATPVIALKFDHRKLIVLDARTVRDVVDESIETDYELHPIVQMLEPRLTPSDNVSMIKPALENWKSATAAVDDEVVLADELGLPHTVNNA